MNYIDIINYIEDESIILVNTPYYHAFQYKKEEFINMITEGIKAPILLGKTGGGYNGKFYVCLSKNTGCKNSIYNRLSNDPMFVIDGNMKTLKTRNIKEKGGYPISFTQSLLPFRESEYADEYQKFLKVPSKDILAIQYNISSNFQQYNNNDYIRHELLILRQMIEDLDSQKIHLPIIDASTSTKINKEKVLSLDI